MEKAFRLRLIGEPRKGESPIDEFLDEVREWLAELGFSGRILNRSDMPRSLVIRYEPRMDIGMRLTALIEQARSRSGFKFTSELFNNEPAGEMPNSEL